MKRNIKSIKSKYDSKLYLVFFSSIFILLFFPVCIFGINAIHKEKNQQLEWYKENQQRQAQSIGNLMNSYFQEMQHISLELLQDEGISSSLKTYDPEDKDSVDLFDRLKSFRTVSSYRTRLPFLNNLLVVSPAKELVISADGWMTMSDYLNTYYPTLKTSLSQIFSQNIFFPIEYLFDGSTLESDSCCQNTIFLTCSLFGTPNSYRIIFSLDRTQFEKCFAGIHNHFFLREAIYLNGIPIVEPEPAPEKWDFDQTYPQTNLRFCFQSRPIPKYLSHYFLDFMVAFLFCIVVSWLLATFFFAPFYRIYAKIARESQVIPQPAVHPSYNPFKAFEIYLDDVQNSQMQLQKKVDHYQQIFRKDDFLLQLLLMQEAENYMDEVIEAWPWFSEEGQYAVGLSNLKTKLNLRSFPQLSMELSRSNIGCHFVKDPSGELAAILIMKNSNAAVYFEKIQIALKETFPEACFCFGSVEYGLQGIQTSYAQARYLQRQVEQDWFDGSFFFPVSIEIQLLGSLKTLDYPAASQILESVFQENSQLKLPDQEKSHFYQMLFFLFQRFALDIQYPADQIQKEFKRLQEQQDTGAIQDFFFQLIHFLIEFQIGQAHSDADHLSEQLYEYVKLHFHDSDICINSVADQFHISRNTLSKSFKSVSEIPLPDLVNRMRISEAVDLIHHSEYTLSEISKLVGFASYSTFKRSFIKNMNISPCEYRETIQNDFLSE